MTFARKRKAGNFSDMDRGKTRPDNATSTLPLIPTTSEFGERELPDPILKTRAQWIKAGKFVWDPHPKNLLKGRANRGLSP
jgi:hypothetical protein